MVVFNRYGFAAALATFGKLQLDQLECKVDRENRVNATVQRFLVTKGVPGISVGVSINGQTVLARGYGFADVENGSPCTKNTQMRIASISKPITAAIAGKLVEMGKLELDKSIYDYVTDFPKKKFKNEEVDITIRQLLSHTAGLRHYKSIYKDEEIDKWDKLFSEYGQSEKNAEMLYRNVYTSMEEAVEMFKNDELVAKPGTEFIYTTHGFTLLGLCLEKASGVKFDRLATKLFKELEMNNTFLDRNEPLIPNRAKFYRRNIKHELVNVPEVDCSYKFASGGIISNVEDLLKFANAMLYSYQSKGLGFLKFETVNELWNSKNVVEKMNDYVLGWYQWPVCCIDKDKENQIWYHTGAAMGASSILVVKSDLSPSSNKPNPQGICVAILVNLSDVDTRKLALEIIDIFEK